MGCSIFFYVTRHGNVLQLSIDEGRSSSSIPEGGALRITTVTLGADSPISNSSRFTGCIAGMIINSENVNLVSALQNNVQHYDVTSHMTESGCGQGSTTCSDNSGCPPNTECEVGWRNYTCVCSSPNRVVDNQCVNPCSSNPCKNGGTCQVLPFSSGGFQCSCLSGFQPPTCELTTSGCGLGFHGPPSCSERCLCDPQGVNPSQVCNGITGECICKVINESLSLSLITST